ncbi:ribonuclease domain-containing protein [Undibacterium sp. Ren11W]|uniref:ribonuclease domain-containing protein n=1 Tax=Undibacterium sp. Ren11W TaxID=3413045 RepID=UPI003BF0DF1A
MNKPMILRRWMAILFLLLFSSAVFSKEFLGFDVVLAHDLPQEAQTTLMLIKQGGPFPYSQDAKVFGNYESKLPRQKRGYYHEYTVKTPRAKNRGARRIIAGGSAKFSGEYYYTDDHYENFRKIQE